MKQLVLTKETKQQLQLKGVYYKRAEKFLAQELSYLREQVHLSDNAKMVYNNMLDAYRQFTNTKRYSDALKCIQYR